jgi:hypothetical protein
MGEDIDSVPKEMDSCETRTPHEHQVMFKTLENPLRRKVVKSIGVFGKSKKEIMRELGLTDTQLKFQLDYLVKMCYAEVEGEKCRLNSKGIDLLGNIK